MIFHSHTLLHANNSSLFSERYYLEYIFGDDLKNLRNVPIVSINPSFTDETSKEAYDLALKGIELGSELAWANLFQKRFDSGAWIRNNLQNPGAMQ
jgi:hypothetical protein